MSKAGEWAAADAAVPILPGYHLRTVEGDAYFCKADRSITLGGAVCADLGHGRLRLSAEEAVKLGRWLIDTFGEEP